MYGTSEIPNVGQVQLSWVPGPSAAGTPRTASVPAASNKDENEQMIGSNESDTLAGRKDAAHEVDYDVAEMEDTWGVE